MSSPRPDRAGSPGSAQDQVGRVLCGKEGSQAAEGQGSGTSRSLGRNTRTRTVRILSVSGRMHWFKSLTCLGSCHDARESSGFT